MEFQDLPFWKSGEACKTCLGLFEYRTASLSRIVLCVDQRRASEWLPNLYGLLQATAQSRGCSTLKIVAEW